MRNKRFLIGALGLAISMLFASSAFAITNVTQTVDGVLGGKEKPKFDKKKFKKTSVKVTTTTADADNPSGMPPKANTAIITFDKKDVKFDSKAVPGCDPNAIENTSTDAALAACGSSQGRDRSRLGGAPVRRRRHAAGLRCQRDCVQPLGREGHPAALAGRRARHDGRPQGHAERHRPRRSTSRRSAAASARSPSSTPSSRPGSTSRAGARTRRSTTRASSGSTTPRPRSRRTSRSASRRRRRSTTTSWSSFRV